MWFDVFFNEKEAVAFLCVSVEQFHRLTKRHLLPCWVSVRNPRKKRWKKRDLQTYKTKYKYKYINYEEATNREARTAKGGRTKAV